MARNMVLTYLQSVGSLRSRIDKMMKDTNGLNVVWMGFSPKIWERHSHRFRDEISPISDFQIWYINIALYYPIFIRFADTANFGYQILTPDRDDLGRRDVFQWWIYSLTLSMYWLQHNSMLYHHLDGFIMVFKHCLAFMKYFVNQLWSSSKHLRMTTAITDHACGLGPNLPRQKMEGMS
jgi:hypothetical protein